MLGLVFSIEETTLVTAGFRESRVSIRLEHAMEKTPE